MNKKFLGIKLGTYLLALGCVALAIIVWVMVQMPATDAEAASLVINAFWR